MELITNYLNLFEDVTSKNKTAAPRNYVGNTAKLRAHVHE